MKEDLRKLIEISSASLRPQKPNFDKLIRIFGQTDAESIFDLLQSKNGFYAFENALHVFSDEDIDNNHGLYKWNSESLWRNKYQGMADRCTFFAEDIFGNQFCLRDGFVFSFDPETGHFEKIALNINEWVKVILSDYSYWTGYPIAHEWQVANGALQIGSRLLPTTPFVFGGKYEISNLHVLDAVKGMRYRASIATQIRDLPDGATLKITIGE